MAGPLFFVLIFCALVAGTGYYVYSNQENPTIASITKFIPAHYTVINQVGDVATMNIAQVEKSARTQVFNFADQPQVQAIENDTNKPVVIPVQIDGKHVVPNYTNQQLGIKQETKLKIAEGQTYGTTNQFKGDLPVDTYQLGRPVDLSGSFKIVKPNSCIVDNSGNAKCQYVTPAIFDYLLEISCKIPENNNCSMDNLQRYQTTDANGNWYYRWQTNTGSMNSGYYLVRASAASKSVDTNGSPFLSVSAKMISLVN